MVNYLYGIFDSCIHGDLVCHQSGIDVVGTLRGTLYISVNITLEVGSLSKVYTLYGVYETTQLELLELRQVVEP